MSGWTIKWLPEAIRDLELLDNSVRIRILKVIKKLSSDPSMGKPLGEKHGLNLTGFMKIEPGAYRIVYYVIEDRVVILVVAVGKREREYVYKLAGERVKELRKKTEQEIEAIASLLKNRQL